MKKAIKQAIGYILFIFGNILSLYLGLWTFFLGQIAKCITLYGNGELTIWLILLAALKFFVGEAVAFSIFWTVNMVVKNYF